MPTVKKRIAVIGCGLRANAYCKTLSSRLQEDWAVVALADPDEATRARFRAAHCQTVPREFTNGPELLEAVDDGIDAVLICSPNALHLESAVPAMGKGIVVLLEKPVGVSPTDCRAMWRQYRELGLPAVLIGFVLRYTPFYQRAKRIIDSGRLGQILTIEMAELLGPTLTALYMKGWRRKTDLSGPFINEKCSHDLDIMNWLVGSKAKQVTSFAGRTRFVPHPEYSDRCSTCTHAEACRYAGRKGDACVFNSDKDIPDHQVVQIAYENGVLGSFTACMDQPRSTRSLKINGSEGQLNGSIHENLIRVESHKTGTPREVITEEFPLTGTEGGHHGGDTHIARRLEELLDNGTDGGDDPQLADGIEACLIGFAAEESREKGTIVEMQTLRRSVLS